MIKLWAEFGDKANKNSVFYIDWFVRVLLRKKFGLDRKKKES
jgi:hypothetical protein